MSGETGDLKSLLAHVALGRTLSERDAEAAFDIIMSGNATPSQIGAFLMALRLRGETVEEITGAARIMRAKAVGVEAPAEILLAALISRLPVRWSWPPAEYQSPSTAIARSPRSRGRRMC